MDDKTNEFLDALFKFKLGEIVYFRATDVVIGRDVPMGYVITERRLQHCDGGLQMAYVIGNKAHAECELTRERPKGRRITDEEAESIRTYKEKTRARIAWFSDKDKLIDSTIEGKDDAKGT